MMTNRSRVVLYTGVTSKLEGRLWEHKNHVVKGFTSKYKLDRLVYYEQFSDPISAITREKEIKAWRREKENNLVRKLNPKWEDLAKKIIWRKCLTAPLVIPNRADGEGPHQSGWRTKTILCDPIPWARSLACARDDGGLMVGVIPRARRESPWRSPRI